VIFSVHALPQSFIDRGDPYRKQIEETVSRVVEQVGLDNWTLSFQSKIGPVKWMQPATIETVRQTVGDGIKQIVVVPIGFVCDHIETLYELDIELAQIAREAGIERFVRAEVFNDYPPFADMLASLVREAVA
jgi:protoporphyrin/coproporphyrin ferrochelatase